MRLTWPLTGRSEEAGVIHAAVAAADLSGLVVCGAAGVGKTRLARDTLSAVAHGHEIRWAVATSSARELPLGALAAWVPTAGGDTLALVRGVVGSLTSGPPGRQVVLGVDDAHLLDDLSVFVLHQIVQRRAAKLVLTVREGEPIPTGLREVFNAGCFDRLDLQPLSREETAILVSAVLAGPVAADAAARLWKLTRGNVLYLRNIVEQEVGDGRLVARHGYWRWEGEPVVSAGLLETIESRIGTLPDSVGEVIDALAVGEPIELAALSRITSPPAVEQAEKRGLIALDNGEGGAQVRVAHPLYGEVRRKRAPATRLRWLRAMVAAELAAGHDRDEMGVVVRRATLSLDSDAQPDPALFLRAAQGALGLADLQLAERLAEAAMRRGAGPEAAFIRAHALGWLARGKEADAVHAAIAGTDMSDAQRATHAVLWASNRLFAMADPVGAKAIIDEAASTTARDGRGPINAFLTVYWAAMGKADMATESSKGLVLEELPRIVGVQTAGAIAVAAGLAGRVDEATNAAAVGYQLVQRTFDTPHMRFWIAEGHTSALMLCGRVGEALTVAEELCRQAADLPGAAPLLATAALGRAALYAGQLDTATALLTPVGELLPFGETNHLAYRHHLPLVIVLGMRGLTDEASAILDALDERLDPAWRHVDYERVLAAAWLCASQGAVTEAIGSALSAAHTAGSDGRLAAEVMCLQTATQFGERTCAPRLSELAELVQGPRAGLAARFAAGLSDGDGAQIASVSQQFEDMGDIVAALDAAAHAAIAYRRKGLRGSALGCASRADALAQRCGANTAALRQASEPLPLTDRQREVVALLGEGLSNRAIADRLTLSVRTVESYVYRAMTQTGVTSREELAALIPRHHSRALDPRVQ